MKPLIEGRKNRRCIYCGKLLPMSARMDKKTCSVKCRMAASRALRRKEADRG